MESAPNRISATNGPTKPLIKKARILIKFGTQHTANSIGGALAVYHPPVPRLAICGRGTSLIRSEDAQTFSKRRLGQSCRTRKGHTQSAHEEGVRGHLAPLDRTRPRRKDDQGPPRAPTRLSRQADRVRQSCAVGYAEGVGDRERHGRHV